MKKTRIFIDLGFHIGNMLKIYLENGLVDDSWAIHLFDPNPEVNIKEIVENFPVKAKVYPVAAWVKKGHISFEASERNNASHVKGTTKHDGDVESKVCAIDFSQFIKDLPEADYIIVSMDIEGSEYSVLEKMLQDGTVERIDLLDIEFHHRFMADKSTQDSQALVDQLLDRGVAVRLRIPFER